jgi:hypothetical protein
MPEDIFDFLPGGELMSADNFVGVRPNKDGTYSIFEYGNMSIFEEDCMYLAGQLGTDSTRSSYSPCIRT